MRVAAGDPPALALEVHPDADAVAQAAARAIAEAARAAVAARGRFALAVSGGASRTPWAMLRVLAEEGVPWLHTHLLQVDERVAPDGDEERNWTHVRTSLLARAPIPAANVHPMPVEEPDLAAAAARYEATLRGVAGAPPVLDCVHLGLGPDGHTASLVPNDPVLDVAGADVAPTHAPYQGRRRLTLTFPALARARAAFWVVTGDAKREVLARLLERDASLPAGRVACPVQRVFADLSAAGDRAP